MPFVLLLKCKMNSILIIMIINNGNTKHGKTSLGWERRNGDENSNLTN